MATRRQERIARVVKEVVSDAIAKHLSDPRISGFVSVTRVDMSGDLRSADVYLSVFSMDPAKDSAVQNKTFAAITQAKSRIQSLLADRLKCKFCPVLRFRRDEKLKKTLETMRLIDEAIGELDNRDSVDQK